jgi:flagellar biosynthetic protein FliR
MTVAAPIRLFTWELFDLSRDGHGAVSLSNDMHGQLTLSVATLYGFLLVLTRVAATFAFVPLPQLKYSSTAARIVLSLAITMALRHVWPVDGEFTAAWTLLGRMAAEAGFGIAIGLVVALVSEAFTLALQVLGIQAGYGYATTIDPNSEADSGVLVALAQLASWMLFLAFGMERHVIRALARSLESYPAGGFAISHEARSAVLSLGSAVFTTALRLALPVIALLLLVDITFALFGKLHAQLQMLSLAFPAKMLVTLGMLALLCRTFPGVYEGIAAQGVYALQRLGGG